MTSKLSRFEGAMLGVAVGDALGAPLEFMEAQEIKSKYGTVRDMLGGGWLNTAPGEVTDDTQMTLAVAAGILTNPHEPIPAVGRQFIGWYKTNPKDIGNACKAAISNALLIKNTISKGTTEAWLLAAKQADKQLYGQTAGNGALMRTIYPALYYDKYCGNFAAAIGAMTHWHDDSRAAVFCYTEAISEIVDGDERTDTGWAKERVELRMKQIRERLGGKHLQPEGWVIASAVCAMNAIRDTNSFEDALVYAVNLGGDADTIGAITGGLAGAIYGSGAIPLRWINALRNEPNNRLCGETDQSGNWLSIRLTKLAHIAYAERTGEQMADVQFREEAKKIFSKK